MNANLALVAGRLAPLIVAGFIPKCGLCVVAWGAALAGIGAEACGSGASWTILGPLIARRLGLSVDEVDALCLAAVASAAATYLWLTSRLGLPAILAPRRWAAAAPGAPGRETPPAGPT